MKKHWFFPLVFLVSAPFCIDGSEKPSALQESVVLRRIAEYWKEGDIGSVKTQIRTFLSSYSESSYRDQLNAMLGDIYFHEQNYKEALIAYDEILGKEFQHKTAFNRIHCLYTVGKFADAISLGKNYLKTDLLSKSQGNTLHFELADSYMRLAKVNDNPLAKEALYKEALVHAHVLLETAYADQILPALAEIYAFFKQENQAAVAFLKLAEKFPERQEEFLFQAASWQVHFNIKEAIATYEKIYRLNGTYASQAACNQMKLLFQTKQYKELLLAQEEALKHIPSDELPLMNYFIGKSLCALQSYSAAIVPLKLFASTPHADPELLKSALLSLMTCSKEAKDFGLFDQTLAHLKTSYPHEDETASALLIHAQHCKTKGDYAKAQADLKEMIALFPEHPQKEALFYDSAVLDAQQKHWSDGILSFRHFLRQYPNSLKKGAAWRHLTLCQIEDSKITTPLTEKIKQENLVLVLSQALEQPKVFSQIERKQLHYLLGKTQYLLERNEEALQTFSEYIADYPNDTSSANAHLMVAYTHLRNADQALFTLNAEKALVLNPDHPSQGLLHLQLYNAYLNLAQIEAAEEKRSLVDKAADHLFLALDQPVKKENVRWLANYYTRGLYHSASEAQPIYFTRAVAVLEKLLGIHEDNYQLEITAGSLEMEAEAIKLSELYGKARKYQEKARLLQALNHIYDQTPDKTWKYQRLSLFELAKTYEKLGKVQRALQAYEFLIQSGSHATSYFATAARLNIALLQYAQIAAPEQHLSAVHKILDTLKDLHIQRKLVTEPAHLEAALCYIDIKSALVTRKEKIETTLKLMRQTRSSLTDLEDPLVQHYFSAKEQFKDNFRLFHQYMQFFSAEEFRYEGMLALQYHDTFRAKELKMKALVQLDALSQEPLHDLLYERVRQSREALNQDL